MLNGFDVAHETFVFGSFHGGTAEQVAVLVGGESMPLLTGHVEESIGGLQLGYVGRYGETVPWAYLLAAVTTVDGVAHLCAYAVGECSTVLNGLVRETT